MVQLDGMATGPLPRLRLLLLVPAGELKEKLAFRVIGLLLVSVSGAPLVLSRSAAPVMLRVPAPRAVVLARSTVPPERVIPPENVLVPESVKVPVPL
jgi:hypothetical protein